MDRRTRDLVKSFLKATLPREELERLGSIQLRDKGFGYDVFGAEKETFELAYFALRWAYLHYFRVESSGHENVPTEGRCILASNHSGVIPIDGAMIGVDILRKLSEPRWMRAVVDNFAAAVPYAGLFLQRCGQVIGTRRNFEELLEADDMVCVFPEGAKGTGKPFSHRYQLLRFNVGFVELAIEHKAPIVPVAVTGAEEQAPMLFDIKPLARALGFPYFPITPTFPWLGPLGMVPYPAKYYIDYGEPFHFHEEYSSKALEDPHRLRLLAGRVRKRVQGMLHKRVKDRPGIYF